jgi:hypothetical protein
MMLAAQAAAMAAARAATETEADGAGEPAAETGSDSSDRPLTDAEARRKVTEDQELAENEFAEEEAGADAASISGPVG